MATMDIFEGDAFTIIELTRALENIPYKPAILSGAGLFGARGVRARTVMIESRDGTLSLIPFSERGSAFESQIPERREMRAFVCRQFKKQDVLWASEIQTIRDFGSETAVQQVQAEVAYKLGRLRNDAEATFEFHLFNGIQGVVKDPKDGATVIDYHAEFGITPAAEVDFDLDNTSPASGALRKRCQALIESVEDTLGGLAAGQVQLRAECGSAFFADLVAHKEVRETYLNTAAARPARARGRGGQLRRHHLPPLPRRARLRRAHRQGVFLPRRRRGAVRDLLRPRRHLRDGQHRRPAALCAHDPGSRPRRMGAARDRKQPAADLHPPAGAALGAADVMDAVAMALDALFADGNIASEAVYTPEGGAPVLVQWSRAARTTSPASARRASGRKPRALDLRVAEVANPRPGDRLEIEGEAFLIQGEPVRDRERLVWTVDLRPAA